MSKREEFDERMAICIHDGGLTEHEARRIAIDQMSDATRDELPDQWKRLNSRWHALATETYGREKMQIARKKLKEKHDVDSFTELTVGQIRESIERIENKRSEA